MSNDDNGIKIKWSWFKDVMIWVIGIISIYITLNNRLAKVEAEQTAQKEIVKIQDDHVKDRLTRIENQVEWIAHRLGKPADRRPR